MGLKKQGREVAQSGAVPPLPLNALMVWAATTLFFTFTLMHK
jgi:hypothetical protein